MKKIVKIGGKEYTMKSSAYTQFKYRDSTGRRMLDDLNKVSKLANLSEEKQIEKTEEITEMLLKMAYIMIDEADSKQIGSFEDFLKSIDSLFDETEWINEVVACATNPFSRGIQTDKESK